MTTESKSEAFFDTYVKVTMDSGKSVCGICNCEDFDGILEVWGRPGKTVQLDFAGPLKHHIILAGDRIESVEWRDTDVDGDRLVPRITDIYPED